MAREHGGGVAVHNCWCCTLTVCVAFIFLLRRTFVAGEQICAGDLNAPVECFECNTRDTHSQYCADPFNRSHPAVRSAICDGPCAKWVDKPSIGPVHYVRTCSSNLNHRLVLSLVCMRQSRPDDGRLCFCHRPLCNGATSSVSATRRPLDWARRAATAGALVRPGCSWFQLQSFLDVGRLLSLVTPIVAVARYRVASFWN